MEREWSPPVDHSILGIHSGGMPGLIQETTFAAIDFESAGSAPGQTDAPVQIGVASMRGLEIHRDLFFESYLASPHPVTWKARKVHGIDDSMIAGSPSLLELWKEVNQRLKDTVLVAHGSGTERRFLRAFPTHGFTRWVDTLVLSRRFYPGLSSYSLGDLAETFQLKAAVDDLCPSRRWHDALYDAAASLVLLQHLIRHSNLGNSPAELLLTHG